MVIIHAELQLVGQILRNVDLIVGRDVGLGILGHLHQILSDFELLLVCLEVFGRHLHFARVEAEWVEVVLVSLDCLL